MDLCDALRAAVGSTPAPRQRGRARSLDQVIDVFGGPRELVSWLAGSSQPSSREYRSAARRIQRYRAGSRHPSADFLRRVRTEATRRASRERRRDVAQQAGAGSSVFVRGTIRVSRDRRHRGINGRFSPGCWAEIRAALAEDDCDGASTLFESCFGEANGFGDRPEITDVDELRVS